MDADGRLQARCHELRAAARGRAASGASAARHMSRRAPTGKRTHLALRLAEVFLVLDDQRQRLTDGRRVQLADAEGAEAARPVECLGDARRLPEVELAERGDELRGLRAQLLVEVGDLERDDLRLLLGSREVDPEMQAAADERLGELARAVRRQHDGRALARADRAELRDAHLEVAEDLQQERLELRVGLVHLVDQEDDLPGRDDRAQQRALEEEVGGEDVARDVVPAPALGAVGLDAKELLLVVPLVERARLVEALVALEADELRAEHLGEDLPELGLAGAGGSLGEERLLELQREEERRLDARDRHVARRAEAVADAVECHIGGRHAGAAAAPGRATASRSRTAMPSRRTTTGGRASRRAEGRAPSG